MNSTDLSTAPSERKSPAHRPIPVLEIFGPTVQGEGMVIGQKTMFVRTAGCDYRCSWCDSAFTWDGSAKDQIRLLSSEDIWSELTSIGGDRFSHVTISGGNPALLPQMGELVKLLQARGIRTAVETQGSKWQDWLMDISEVTLSPKPPSSGMTTDWQKLDEIVQRLANRASDTAYSLKVVIFDEKDLEYARKVHKRYPEVSMYLQTGNPDVTTGDVENHASSLLHRYEWLIDRTMELPDMNEVRVLPQLHTLVWGNKRGV
ncbi:MULTISPECIES: 7-carboxy-7-deazaguanine synthase QueE [unclassified Paenibacillus]|uniref:7-carboxy-7-deazaguanine synthase QueE n=1 Tax=unclassified Paenibacillus TaxID=185978 RepID=UPI000897ACFB|nr:MULTISPECIES: 7-carboxy-7-deazaguanine synthase QueE [unclassified Paenibacillus]OMC71972.1 7-carboxy-7-deazaguanine synthase QueE [Paenibacillus sp. FSL H7-0326]SDX32330.1 preQ(0) biosynthesis protein QueE [Paenibacillus sp. PDC88]